MIVGMDIVTIQYEVVPIFVSGTFCSKMYRCTCTQISPPMISLQISQRIMQFNVLIKLCMKKLQQGK